MLVTALRAREMELEEKKGVSLRLNVYVPHWVGRWNPNRGYPRYFRVVSSDITRIYNYLHMAVTPVIVSEIKGISNAGLRFHLPLAGCTIIRGLEEGQQ